MADEPTQDGLIAQIDKQISDLIDTRISSSAKIHPSYSYLWSNIKQTIMAGGKRTRPQLVAIGYGQLDDAIIPVASAYELIHTAMLAHDDVIDRDTVRRGKPTINGVYVDRYSTRLSAADRDHQAYGAGILAGDLLISESYCMIMASTFSSDIKTSLVNLLHRSIYEVVGGELLDVEAAFMDDYYDPLLIARYKTASYSFVGPLLAGAICAEAPKQILNALEEFGQSAGTAYQLQDDVLGLFGVESKTGKSTIGDLREGKATVLIKHHKDTLAQNELNEFQAVFGNSSITTEQANQIKHAIKASGALEKTKLMINQYYAAAKKSIANLPASQQEQLLALLNKLENRTI